MAGQILIVSGTSGSGKSTTCELFAKRAEDFWLLFGIDHLMANMYPPKFGHHGPRAREGIYAHPLDEADPDGPLRWSFGEKGTRTFNIFHEWIAEASRQGSNIVIDHLLMSDPPLLRDCVERLAGLPVLFVSLKPSFEVLTARIAGRKNDKKLPAADFYGNDAAQRAVERLDRLRRFFYDTVYANDVYDLELDTVSLNPEQVCQAIETRMAQGPGTAFETLRMRFAG